MKSTVRLILVLVFATNSFAEPLTRSLPNPCPHPSVEELRIKIHKSSAETPEPLLTKPKPVVIQGCDRPFLYRGDFYSADSPQAQDAATLKTVIQSVPEASAFLDEYQSNREKSRISAYTGTFGLLLLFFAPAISRGFFEPSSRESVFTALQISGIALSAGGFFYSFTLLRTNEYLIPKAVDTYNATKKEDPVELRFSTGWSF